MQVTLAGRPLTACECVAVATAFRRGANPLLSDGGPSNRDQTPPPTPAPSESVESSGTNPWIVDDEDAAVHAAPTPPLSGKHAPLDFFQRCPWLIPVKYWISSSIHALKPPWPLIQRYSKLVFGAVMQVASREPTCPVRCVLWPGNGCQLAMSGFHSPPGRTLGVSFRTLYQSVSWIRTPRRRRAHFA